MMYLLYGDNTDLARSKLRGIIDSQTKKTPDAVHFRLTTENFSEEKLEELLGSGGLFQNAYIVVLDNLFQDEKAADAILVKLSEIEESQNIFIVLETNLTKAILTKLEKKSAKTQTFALSTKLEKKKPEFSVFTLSDALGARDKKKLWTLFIGAKQAGVSSEEIHPILLWQIKAMLGAVGGSSALEAGLNPFVYTKAKSFSKNFRKDELGTLSRSLIDMYHEVRRGLIDFDIALERWILSL